MRFQINGTTGETFAKRMLKLAYDASAPMGLGFIQARAGRTEDDVFDNAVNRGDYPSAMGVQPGEINADYVFGRMMKLRFKYGADYVEIDADRQYRPDYQSFCGKYPNGQLLVDATCASLGCTVVEVAKA